MYCTVSPDALEALLTQEPLGPESFSLPTGGGVDGWRQRLRENGVVFGIDQDLLSRFADYVGPPPTGPLRLAVGLPAIHETIVSRYHFPYARSVPAGGAGAGPANFRLQGFALDTFQGQLLAEQVAQNEGAPGRNVRGEVIPSERIQARPIVCNANVLVERSGPATRYSSKIDGVLLNDRLGVLEVQPELTIREDINYANGNISVRVPVMIEGDVRAGFSVRSGRQVTVRGTVERDAVIECDGPVIIEGGLSAGAIVKSRGALTVRFAYGARLEAEGDIEVGEYLYDCRLRSAGRLICHSTRTGENRGVVVGGELNAYRGMDLVSAGGPGTLTTLAVGCDLAGQRNVKELGDHLRLLRDEAQRNLRRAGVDVLSADIIRRLDALPEARRLKAKDTLRRALLLLRQLKGLEQRQRELQVQCWPLLPEAKIEITKRAFPDLNIINNSGERLISEELPAALFTFDDGQVSVRSLTGL